MKLIDLTGQKFNRLTVISRSESRGFVSYWNCKCECGNVSVVQGGNLKSGRTKSCGCLQKEAVKESNATHGMSECREYNTWEMMIHRCTNSNYDQYKNYGGRGIIVCDRWMKFENFFADMGERPEGMSLDRIDSNGDYEPDNCRWATSEEQNRNRRNNVMLTFLGRTQCQSEWAKELGIAISTLYNRLNTLNWSVEKALTVPARVKIKRI